MCDLSGCDLQLAVFLLLSLFWTKHHPHHQIATTNNAPEQLHQAATTFTTTNPTSQASPRLPFSNDAQHRGGLLTACAFLFGRIAAFPREERIKGGSRPLFLRPIGERGPAPEVILIRIFAYPPLPRGIKGRTRAGCSQSSRGVSQVSSSLRLFKQVWSSCRRIVVLGPIAVCPWGNEPSVGAKVIRSRSRDHASGTERPPSPLRPQASTIIPPPYPR